jgi:hypothetical protein
MPAKFVTKYTCRNKKAVGGGGGGGVGHEKMYFRCSMDDKFLRDYTVSCPRRL